MKAKWIGFVAACCVLAAWGVTVHADPPPPTLWATQIGTSEGDYGGGIAVDGGGNSYITGHTDGDLGGPNQGFYDAFVVACDSGGTVQWSRQIGTSDDDEGRGIAVDGSGNSYITGVTYGNLGGPNQGPPGTRDAFIAKCDSGGTVQWTRQIGSIAEDAAFGIAVDASGNSYISGFTYGDLGGPNQGGADAFIVACDSGGTVQWTRQIGTTAGDIALGIALDGSGNIYIAGATTGDLGGPNQGDIDAFVVKYDSAGTEQWIRQIGTTGWDSASDVAVDGSGNVFITGPTEGDLGGPHQGGRRDAFVVKYDSGGTEQWIRQMGTSDGDWGNGIAVDGSGNSYIVGPTYGDLGGPNQGGMDAFIIKYDSGGTVQWIRQIGTASANDIAVDGSGNSYITGETRGDLGGANQGGDDAFIVAIGTTLAALEVDADIKPGSWPNPLNPVSKGVLPLAVCGGDEFDVMTIDTETILLGREGIDGLVPLRWSYEDVATPFEGDPCDGHDLDGDGFMDLTLKFSTQELMSVLGLGDLAGETVPLLLTGSLMDGTALEGIDCVWVLARGDGNMDGLVDGLDYIAWSNHYRTGTAWSEGDYTGDGYVDGLDYVAWSNNYLAGCPAAVPEPAALALLGLGALALLRRRRHKA